MYCVLLHEGKNRFLLHCLSNFCFLPEIVSAILGKEAVLANELPYIDQDADTEWYFVEVYIYITLF